MSLRSLLRSSRAVSQSCMRMEQESFPHIALITFLWSEGACEGGSEGGREKGGRVRGREGGREGEGRRKGERKREEEGGRERGERNGPGERRGDRIEEGRKGVKREREESERRERGRGRCYENRGEGEVCNRNTLLIHTPALCRSRGTRTRQSSCHTRT